MKLRLEVLLYCTRFLYENSELNWLLLLMLDSHSACVDIIIKNWKKQDKGMHKTAYRRLLDFVCRRPQEEYSCTSPVIRDPDNCDGCSYIALKNKNNWWTTSVHIKSEPVEITSVSWEEQVILKAWWNWCSFYTTEPKLRSKRMLRNFDKSQFVWSYKPKLDSIVPKKKLDSK